MKTRFMMCALAVAAIAIGAAACGKKKSSSGNPSFPEPGTLTRIDRMGRPAIATIIHKVLDTSNTSVNGFNQASPSMDGAFAGAVGQLVGLLHACPAPAVAGALLPDILTYDAAAAANYASLNGRALTDDVFDDTLHAVYTNSNGVFGCGTTGYAAFLSSGDHITMNDKAFPGTFPFLANPF